MAGSRSLLEAYGHYIDGQWTDPDSGRYDVVNPATEAVIQTAPDASVAQVRQAVAAARSAFDTGPWPTAEPAERARCLQQLSDALMARGEEVYALAQAEWGCSANERLIHVDGPAFMVGHAAELATEPAEAPMDAWGAAGTTLLRYEPLGVVAAMTPWNFPHTLNVMKLGAALAAGNTLVLKPSPLTPLAGLALARIIDEDTDIPPGVVNVVTPTSVEASRSLTLDPRVDMVSFTGSSVVGRDVMAGAATTMKRVLLECGGKSATILLPDVDVSDDLLDRLLFEGCTMHAGQACILNSRLLLPEAIHDEVVDRLAELSRGVVIGDPVDPAVTMGPLISREQLDRVEGFVKRAEADGATVVAGGARPKDLNSGFYFEPTILTDASADSYIAQEEVFGPVLTVLRYRDDDDAVTIANNSSYGLGGAVWGSDIDRAVAIARRIRTGQVSVNGTIPGDAPFGGFKQSGIGREGGVMGLRAYMEPKAIGIPA
ncbi:aldehyde dehydrogenase family protein [Mycobacterium intracellulare]|uniref:Aldehyde dehydrogenase family protein n=1 Tax=Mycobacterium intracellulare subsp. chimaera TaxID=222805 RepID=A0A7U5MJ33_MYCIT|nr:aldehyde dehydrogenase family protein [Mycobacterium intracellulare]ASL14508.1 NAD-dependent aldehyde dehydrogenase [Mycobacterium intracellulare subsp. chimaera]ASQ85758.1 aldehyde dehydrogenase [Mycobacterium intracellulare subsp. chimaera]MCF1813593.1 aldehyde dehydrogenase family protein [Mycobacterium intracellulare subsp. intracellulare]MDM3928870.1 aldehyde dehydrogenase family protein [Mycobacterium intracellulare subsp. chimaera]MDS0335305.1 aldehyde dehydrogenase family protein [M